MMTTRSNSNKRTPQRTCVACRQVKDKRQLVRLVSNASGVVSVDSAGRQPGRGAYLCQLPQCWQKGLAGNQIEHALKAKISSENREQLAEYGRSLIGGL